MQKPKKQHWHDESGEEDFAREEEKPLLSSSLPLLSSFPEEIVEMIIARMPFPSLLKSRFLSNSWNLKFSRPWDDSPRTDPTPFQKDVSSVSHKWPTYCPVFVTRKGLLGFDRVTSQWKTLFPRCEFHIESYPEVQSMTWSFAGSLMLTTRTYNYDGFISVRNAITGSSTQLHLDRVEGEGRPLVVKLLHGVSDNSYRVLKISRIRNHIHLRRYELQTALYDSKAGGWTTETHFPDLPEQILVYFNSLKRCSYVYLHGKLYYLCVENTVLCRHNVDSDKRWAAIRLSFSHHHHGVFGALSHVAGGGILLCGEKIMMIRYSPDYYVYIYELNVDSFDWTKPTEGLKRVKLQRALGFRLIPELAPLPRFASDNDFIYIDEDSLWTPVITYNVHSGKWGTLPPVDCCWKNSLFLDSGFTPGPNPFAIIHDIEESDAGPEFCP